MRKRRVKCNINVIIKWGKKIKRGGYHMEILMKIPARQQQTNKWIYD